MKLKNQFKVLRFKKQQFFIIGIFLIFCANFLSLQSQDWKTCFDSTMYYYYKLDNPKIALEWGIKSKELAEIEFGTTSIEYHQTLAKLVDIYFDNDLSDKALETSQQDSLVTLDLYGKQSEQHIGCLNNLGLIYLTLVQYRDAENLLKSAISALEEMPNRSDSTYAFSLNNLAMVYEKMGLFIKAEPLYINSIEIIRKLEGEKSSNYAETVHNLAVLYKRMGQFNKSDTLYQRSVEIHKNIYGEKHHKFAIELNQLGDLYKEMGRYNEAESMYKQTVKLRRELFGEEHPEYAKSLSNLGHFYFVVGRFEQAEDLFKEALGIIEQKKGVNNPEYASTANNLALLYHKKGDFINSEKLFVQVLGIYEVLFTKKHPFYATTLDNLGRVYKDMKLYTKAEELFFKAKEIRKELLGDKHPNYAKTLFNLATLYEVMGQYPSSESLFLEVLNIRKEKLGVEHLDYAKNLSGLAGLYSKWEKFNQAEPYYIEALNKYLLQVKKFFPYMSEKEKLQFWTDVRPNFESFDAFCSVYFSFKPEIVSYMYNNVLATKGLILSSTKKVLSKIRQSKDTSVTNVLNRWQDTKDFWLLLTQNPEKAKEYKVSIDSIADLANELEKELSSKSEDFKNAFSAKEITWQDVQKTLKPGEAAIELVRFRNEGANDNPNEESIFYAALIVKQNTKNYPEITIINNGSELEDNYVKLYGNLVKILKIQPISERTPLEMELLESDQKDLYKQFWGRVNDKLKGIKKVYLSLDGVYNSINLMTLVNPQTSKYLIEELDLRIVTNTKDLIEYAKPKQKNIKNTAQLIGDPLYNFDLETEGWVPPLPGTKYEVEKISSDMIKKNWNVKTYLGKDALEQTIKSVENPKILHIATHGMFLPEMESNSDNNILGIDAQQLKENPLLRSMLLFAGVENKNEENNTNDGKLTAYEAMDLALDNTDIVVLSACETGLGEVKNGEGVYGLQRAFQVAGAKSLIMSLWTVSDEATQHLMTKFYDRILKGTNKRQAFREAQIDLKKTYPEFYYWGAFVMVGE